MKSKLTKLVALLAASLLPHFAQAVTIDYDGLDSFGQPSKIVFTGGGFSFSPTGDNIHLHNGMAGAMSGTFTLGAITPIAPGIETAPVLGSGTFVVHDGLGNDLNAVLVWNEIGRFGPGETLNVTGSLNLTNISYTGLNADLLAFAGNNAVNVATFQFTSGITLTDLSLAGSGGGRPADYRASFSGTISVPDGGTTVLLLGFALSALAVSRRKFAA
jgi:hypothetical protein